MGASTEGGDGDSAVATGSAGGNGVEAGTDGTAAGSGVDRRPRPASAAPPQPGQTEGATDVGVTVDEIRIGTYSAISGPFAMPQFVHSLDAAVADVNARGGINGRRIKFIVYDVQRDTNKALAAAKRLVEEDHVFAILAPLGQEPANVAIAPYLEEKGVPGIGVTSWDDGPALSPLRWFRNIAAERVAPLVADFVTDNLERKKVAISWNGAGKQYELYFQTYKEALVRNGAEIVYEKKLDPNDLATALGQNDAEVTNMRAAGADVLLGVRCCYMWPRTMRRQGWTTAPVLLPTSAEFGAWDIQTLELCGEECNDLLYTDTQGYYHPSVDTPELRRLRQAMDKYNPDHPELAFNQIVSWGHAQMLFEAIRAQGNTLTRQGLVEWFNNLRNYNDGLSDPFSFTTGDHNGQRSTMFVQARDGGFVPVTGMMGGG